MDGNRSRNLFWILLLLYVIADDVVEGKFVRSSSNRNNRPPPDKIYGLCPDHPSVRSLLKKLNKTLNRDVYYLSDGISIKKDQQQSALSSGSQTSDGKIYAKRIKGQSNMCEYVAKKAIDYTADHYLNINLAKAVPTTARLLYKSGGPRLGFGKNSFLTGFGLGFLAFGLKKLLLPIIIGAQIIKSILIAMFLPSILGSVGKLVGKGVTTFAQSSGSSNYGAGAAASDNLNDFDFKDTQQQQQQQSQSNNYDVDSAGSDNAYGTVWTYPSGSGNQIGGGGSGYNHYHHGNDFLQPQQSASSSFSSIGTGSYNGFPSGEYNNYNRVKPTSSNKFNASPTKLKETSSSNKYHTGSFYTKDKTEDFKVFHNIPTSSHLLANYDPFYSPLLSRIDSVFKQLAYSTETCRERLVCNMYKNPAKYAPFSNLVSAQLSRELNELRKPSSDNPEILRFFRYMKAAKDGQDGHECEIVYADCTSGRGPNENAPMVSTFNDINKLVQARSTS